MRTAIIASVKNDIQCDEIECLSRHMTEHHDFQLDPKRTVFYGICNECRKNT